MWTLLFSSSFFDSADVDKESILGLPRDLVSILELIEAPI
jgi:hypothetical protein